MENRREALRTLSLGTVTALTAIPAFAGPSTPQQPEGPFYPGFPKAHMDTDLTRTGRLSPQAKGEQVIVHGVVQDENDTPVPKAIVEIWQACASGRYNHPADPSPMPLDENFQYWARMLTDDHGHYKFRTVVPGNYEAGEGWIRPSHIHYKVLKRGYSELTTQMYFAGNRHNGADRILSRLAPDEQDQVIIEFRNQAGFDVPTGEFNITLEKIS